MNLLLIGCGNLGKALLSTWSANKVGSRIIVVQPSLSAQNIFQSDERIVFINNIKNIPNDFSPSMVVLALKPQQLQAFMLESGAYLTNKLIISFLAGTGLNKLQSYFNCQQKIIRIMPNVAMKIGQSVNLVYSADNMEKSLVDQVFSISGKMIWLSSEEAIDLLTPLSASGPAYFFLLAEILTQITVNSGLDENIAKELIQQTFLGSALLAKENNNFEQLISSVSSRGGVTEAALKILQPILLEAMNKAIIAALNRGEGLTNENHC